MQSVTVTSTLALTFLTGLAMGQEPCSNCGLSAHSRTGNAQSVAPYAKPSDTGRYVGYYVGGGAAWRGDPRALNEGTWGWDYQGFGLPRQIALQWTHGRRYQGGTGAYKTDGCPVPNVLAFPPPSKHE
jgi:hypothetical protein